MERGGQFQMDLGGQFAWIFHWNKLTQKDLQILASSANLNITVKLLEKKLEGIADDNYWGWVGEVK